MSKGLKALYKIANAEMKEQYKASKNGFIYRVISDEYSKELNTIETELKNYELLLEPINQLCEIMHINDIDEMVDKVEKELKALEIIKEKRVNVADFVRCESIEDYNDYCCYRLKDKLTQEEFDLLKEVLL